MVATRVTDIPWMLDFLSNFIIIMIMIIIIILIIIIVIIIIIIIKESLVLDTWQY